MIRDYIHIARPDHWFKNVFMAPGIVLGWLACPPGDPLATLGYIALAVVATCLVCSSNYTINELLDAPMDRKHPVKRNRPAASGRVRPWVAYVQWLALGAAGLALARIVSFHFFAAEAVLFVMGIIYNIRPMRSKDWPYVDVLSESINNPLRLLLGWYATRCTDIPPGSLLLAYWMLGAYFMAIKRYAELRNINHAPTAAAYRRSFAFYTPDRLLTSVLFYATAAGLFGGVFLIRYRIELILAVPFLAGFMAYYMHLGFLPDSPTQNPEKLYKHRFFTLYACLTAAILLLCLSIHLPWLDKLFQSTVPQGFR